MQIDNTLGFNGEVMRVNVDDNTLLSSPNFRVNKNWIKNRDSYGQHTLQHWVPSMQTTVGGYLTVTWGNGSVDGLYMVWADTVYFTARYTFGSTTNFNGGTGEFRFSLPTPPTSGWLNRNGMNHAIIQGQAIGTLAAPHIGFLRSQDFVVATGMGRSGTEIGFSILSDSAALWGSGVPGAWANTHTIFVAGSYSINKKG